MTQQVGEHRLIPKPHLLRSIRSRNWSLAGAIGELVDNSLGHGKARNIDIMILGGAEGGVAVLDDGIGIDDVNRVFRLGDAGAVDVMSEIGQYGVGATDAVIYLGDVTEVTTVYEGRVHEMAVDWLEVEDSGLWPLRYNDAGRKAEPGEFGTRIYMTDPTQKSYQMRGIERLASELGATFAPALRSGVKIVVIHRPATGERRCVDVTPFTVNDLTHEIAIGGEILAKGHTLRWSGRAGLSPSLTERHNGVHIAFGHRVIEQTRDPFQGKSAPTLYCEVTLDADTPWKFALSDHKDKVVRFRDALMGSINAQLGGLLQRSAEEAGYLLLTNMAMSIEEQLTIALRGAGLLDRDEPEGEPSPGRTPSLDKRPGDGARKPTGVKLAWLTKEQLDGKLWSWDISDRQIVIKLDKEDFGTTASWPPRFRDQYIVRLVSVLLSHAIELEYVADKEALNKVITGGLRQQIAQWAEDHRQIAPYVNRAILEVK